MGFETNQRRLNEGGEGQLFRGLSDFFWIFEDVAWASEMRRPWKKPLCSLNPKQKSEELLCCNEEPKRVFWIQDWKEALQKICTCDDAKFGMKACNKMTDFALSACLGSIKKGSLYWVIKERWWRGKGTITTETCTLVHMAKIALSLLSWREKLEAISHPVRWKREGWKTRENLRGQRTLLKFQRKNCTQGSLKLNVGSRMHHFPTFDNRAKSWRTRELDRRSEKEGRQARSEIDRCLYTHGRCLIPPCIVRVSSNEDSILFLYCTGKFRTLFNNLEANTSTRN